jgi:HlyD family secretion protein
MRNRWGILEWGVVVGSVTVLGGCARATSNGIEATGTLEVVEYTVSPSVAARVGRVLVEEGAAVKPGDTLVILGTPTLSADLAARAARARAADAASAELANGARPAELERAQAELAAATADADRAAADEQRLKGLAQRSIVSAQQYDAARALAASTAARRTAAASALQLMREGARQERRSAAAADAAGAAAGVSGLEALQHDLVLLAPVAGTVLSRVAEPGEVLGPGQPALVLGATARQTVRVFVNQGALSRVQPGQAVHAVLDAYPGKEFAGRVVALSTKAEFTPRVALTEKERADLLFGVKIEFTDATGMLKAGLPITVHIDAPAPTP